MGEIIKAFSTNRLTNQMKLSKGISYRIFLLGVLLLAFFLRFKDVLNGDFFYGLDQARDLLLVKEMFVNHRPTLIGGRAGFGGLFHGPLWLYIITPFFIVTKGDPFMTLVPVFMTVELMTVFLGYLFFSSLYGKKTGIVMAGFLAISRPLIKTSFNFSNSNLMPLVFLIYLFLVINYLRGRDIYFIPLLFIIGLGFQFEAAFSILLVPLTVILIFYRKKFPSMKLFIYGMVFFTISVSNFIIFEIRHQFLMTHSLLRLFKNPPLMHDYEQFSKINFRIIDRLIKLGNYFFEPLFLKNLIGKAVIVFLLASGSLLIFKLREDKQFKKEFVFIFFIPFLCYFFYIFYPYPLWSHYTVSFSVASSLLITLLITKLWNVEFFKWLVGLFLILIYIPAFLWVLQNYSFKNGNNYGKATYKSQLAVAKYIFEDAGSKQFGYLVYDHGSLTYHMDYLIWWLASKNDKVTVVNNKQPITYLIIYPPPAYAKSEPEYWKKNVVRTKGKVVNKKIFPSGIYVEKIKINQDEPPVDPNYFQNLIFR